MWDWEVSIIDHSKGSDDFLFGNDEWFFFFSVLLGFGDAGSFEEDVVLIVERLFNVVIFSGWWFGDLFNLLDDEFFGVGEDEFLCLFILKFVSLG